MGGCRGVVRNAVCVAANRLPLARAGLPGIRVRTIPNVGLVANVVPAGSTRLGRSRAGDGVTTCSRGVAPLLFHGADVPWMREPRGRGRGAIRGSRGQTGPSRTASDSHREDFMSITKHKVLLALGVLVLVAVVQWGVKARQTPNLVLSGSDIGFRVEGEFNGKPYGTFVLKINGKWVEIGPGLGRVMPAGR